MSVHEENKQPLVSIDVVPIAFIDGRVRVALGARKFEPFIGQLALPGVLLLQGELIADAAYRALESKVGIHKEDVRSLKQVAAFDNPDRDPRGPTISIAFVAIVDPEASLTGSWETDYTELPFDHFNIIEDGLAEVAFSLWRHQPTTKAIMGTEFSTADAIAVSEQITTGGVDRTNFTRMLKNYGSVEQTGSVKTGKGRPSATWKFTR